MQYFLWYIVLLPFYLPNSSLLTRPRMGITAAVLWVASQVSQCSNSYYRVLTEGQALYLHRAYALEFLGQSTFVSGLWLSSLLFFAVNIWILGIVIDDIGGKPSRTMTPDNKPTIGKKT